MTPQPPLFYLIAGEPSGDLLGARLMAGLKQRLGGEARFAGIGGEMMRAEGLDSLFPMAELSIMGLAEVVPRIPRILRRMKQTVADIEARHPAALITIDSSGFNGRIHRRLKALHSRTPRLHYVAPMVWAWREGRARHLGERIDLLMCLLPNEPDYFIRHGCPAQHVGHPVIESGAGQGDGDSFRSRHGLVGVAPLLCLLPGSRHNEVGKLLPVFEQTVARLAGRYPGLRVVVPTVETVAEAVSAAVRHWAVPVLVVRGARDKYDAFAACDAALAASGTVALELALAGLPNIITYKVSPLTAVAARRLLKVTFVNLVNLLMDRAVVPELLQENCRPDRLAEALVTLLEDPQARDAQRAGMAEAMRRLGLGQDSPSLRAADAVLADIGLKPMEDPS